MKIRDGNDVQSKIGLLLYGCEGSGKSTFAVNSVFLKNADGSPMKILYIDCENGSVDDYTPYLQEQGADIRNLKIAYTTSFSEVRYLIDRVAKNLPIYADDKEKEMILDVNGNPFNPDMIVVDGSTVLYDTTLQGTREFSQKRAGIRADKQKVSALEKAVMVEGAGPELKDYNQIKFKGKDLVLTLAGTGKHYIITAREKEETRTIEIVKNGKTETMSVGTGKFIPDGFKDIGYNAKTVARLYRDSDDDPTVKMFVKKDRTGTFVPYSVTEDPSVLEFQNTIDKSKDRPEYIIENDIAESVKKEVANTEKELAGVTNDESISGVTEKPAEKTDEEIMAELKEQIKALKKSLNTPKLIEIFESKCMESGIPTKGNKLVGVEQYRKYLELIQETLNK